LHLVHEDKLAKDSFWNPYFKLLRRNYNNIMFLTEPQMKTLLRRPGCENTYNLGVMMRYIYICMCICTYVCVCVYIYSIYTYI
jgi:hypothetical protein